jgi:ATP-binding cassette, subfamily B, multidrug efflux pump
VSAQSTGVAPRRPPVQPMQGPGRWIGGGGPVEKPMDFKGSSRRLLAMLRPERLLVAAVLGLGATSVVLAVTGPRILGRATDLIFSGVVGGKIPPGVSQAQAVAQLRREGNNTLADMLAGMHVVPGQGIDFAAVGHVLSLALLVYVFASIFSLFQGRLAAVVVQHTVYRLREQVENKLSRLPLRYFDGQPRGEVLSRVTNDIDNISMTLQQTMSQLVTSVLTIIGVLVMMILISPLLALVALVTVPASVLIAARIGKRAQPQFVSQWATTGRLNAHIEEMYTGHALVKVFGRQDESAEVFAEHNETLYGSSFRAQFISGTIQPAMSFLGNIGYVLIAVVGGLKVASGTLSIGDVQAFIQYSRQFTQPITQVASMANLLQSGVASAERVFELLDAAEQSPDPAQPARPEHVAGHVAFEHVSFSYDPDRALIEDLSLSAEPGRTVAIVGPTGAGKTPLVNLLMRFYEIQL